MIADRTLLTEHEMLPVRTVIDGEVIEVSDPDQLLAMSEALELIQRVGDLMRTRMPDRDGIVRAELLGPIDALIDLAKARHPETVAWEIWP